MLAGVLELLAELLLQVNELVLCLLLVTFLMQLRDGLLNLLLVFNLLRLLLLLADEDFTALSAIKREQRLRLWQFERVELCVLRKGFLQLLLDSLVLHGLVLRGKLLLSEGTGFLQLAC